MKNSDAGHQSSIEFESDNPEELSIYDIKDYPDLQYSIGDVVLNNRATENETWVGEIIEIKDGRLTISWITGRYDEVVSALKLIPDDDLDDIATINDSDDDTDDFEEEEEEERNGSDSDVDEEDKEGEVKQITGGDDDEDVAEGGDSDWETVSETSENSESDMQEEVEFALDMPTIEEAR